MRLATVATFWYPAQAHLAKARLEGAGIPCRIANEHTLNVHGAAGVIGGVKLQVPEDRVREAREALRNADLPDDDGEADDYIVLATFDDPEEAHEAAAALDDAGIPHSLAGEGAFGADAGQVTLAVPLARVAAAQAVLHGA